MSIISMQIKAIILEPLKGPLRKGYNYKIYYPT